MNTLESQEGDSFRSGVELAGKAKQARLDSKNSFALGGFLLAAGALWLGGNYLVGDMTPAQEKRAVIQASVLGTIGVIGLGSGAFEARMTRRFEAESNEQLAQAEALRFGRTAVHVPDVAPESEQPVALITPIDTGSVQ